MLRPHYPTPIAALVLVLSAWLLSFFGVTLQIDPSETQQTIDPGLAGIAQALAFGLVASFAARRVPAPQALRLGLSPLALRYLPLVVMGAPFAIVASELDNWLTIPFPSADPEAVGRALEQARELTPLAVAQAAIFRIGIEPVVTEFLFRGVIQQGLIAYVGRFTGVLITAALSMDLASALATGGSPVSGLVLSLLLGLTLGYMRIGTGSLLAPILLRATWNGMALFGVVYAEQFPVPGFNTFGGDHTNPILLAACSACVVWAAIELLRALRFHPVVLPIADAPDPAEDAAGAGFF
jgi:membrane protease YdiL (CAAX protease family)